MSMRARTGAVQAFVQPGTRVFLSRLSISSAVVIGRLSGQTRPSARLTGRGAQLEYQRRCSTRGHSERGLSRIVVSAIDSGAGSVAVSARPILPYTASMPGCLAIRRFCVASSNGASSWLMPGAVVGM